MNLNQAAKSLKLNCSNFVKNTNFDRLIDNSYKLITILGVFFGAYAYFNSIKPVFDKEQDLQKSKSELIKLNNEKQIINSENIDLENKISEAKSKLDHIEKDYLITSAKLKEQEEKLQDLTLETNLAINYAVFEKLKSFSRQVFSEYLLSMQYGKSKEFDVLSYSRSLIEQDFQQENKLNLIAREYLEKFIDSYEGKNIKITEYVTRIHHDYEFQFIKNK